MFCRLIALAVALACVGAAVLLLLPHEVHQQLRSHIVLPKVVTLDGALLDERFTAWSQAWSKTYATSEERASRLRNFAVTLAQVEAHNARSDVSWQMGLNEFSDWTDDEFMAYFNLGAMLGHQARKAQDDGRFGRPTGAHRLARARHCEPREEPGALRQLLDV